MPPYVVRELEGWRIGRGGGGASGAKLPGLTVVVQDAGHLHRVVDQFHSEDHRPSGGAGARENCRRKGAALAARLNAEQAR